MPILVNENVEVIDTETEIIGPTDTDKTKDRIFTVSNGENEIEVKAYGKNNDGGGWQERGTTMIPPNTAETLTVGPTVTFVKLIGRTISGGQTSIVDATLVW